MCVVLHDLAGEWIGTADAPLPKDIDDDLLRSGHCFAIVDDVGALRLVARRDSLWWFPPKPVTDPAFLLTEPKDPS